MENKGRYIVYVAMLVYNHERYISQAIEGVIMQQTSFDYKLIIADDCSIDNSQKICKQYAAKYPDRVELLLNKKNIGVNQNFKNLLNVCEGKYIAFCEGDDYWTDANKLEKQVLFLENNPDYSLCFHRSEIFYEEEKRIIPQNSYFTHNQEFNPLVAYQDTIFQSASMVFRKDAFFFPDHYDEYIFPDSAIILSLAQNGRFYGFTDVMSVYRKHKDGLSMPSWKKATDFIKMMDLIDIDFGKGVYSATKYRRYTRYKYMASIYVEQLDLYLFLLSMQKCFKYDSMRFLKRDFYKFLIKLIKAVLIRLKK